MKPLTAVSVRMQHCSVALYCTVLYCTLRLLHAIVVSRANVSSRMPDKPDFAEKDHHPIRAWCLHMWSVHRGIGDLLGVCLQTIKPLINNTYLHYNTISAFLMHDIERANDEDIVPPDPRAKPSKQPPPKPDPVPNFQPFVSDKQQHGKPNIPPTLDLESPIDIFDHLLDQEVIDVMVKHTNMHVRSTAKPVPANTPWVDVTKADLYAFIGILCYDAVEQSSDWRNYWNTDPRMALHPAIVNSMSQDRFRAIQRWFCIANPTASNNDRLPFEALEPLNSHLLEIFKRVWTPGANVAVDETVYRFEGRASWTVTIPSKPYPIGAKIWITADGRFVLHWIWHVKGDLKSDGLYQLDPKWAAKGFSKTACVVFQSMDSLPEGGRGITVWLDNLITENALCLELRNMGIGCAGTVRTSKTPREYMEEDGMTPDAAKEAAIANEPTSVLVS
jgi:hypothetical protein